MNDYDKDVSHLDEFDQEMMLEQIKLIELDEDIQNYLIRDQLKYLDRSFNYEELYHSIKDKAFLAIKLVKRLV